MTTKTDCYVVRIARLAWPLFIGQIAVIANGVIDTAMTSRFSATDLAALAIGASIYISIFVGLNGILQALLPMIGQLFGAQQFNKIGAEIRQGIWLTLFLSIVGCVALFFPQPLLALTHSSAELHEKSILYLRILALALPATLGFRLYSILNTAIGRPKMLMALQIVALLIKIPVNALFIFGGWGIPALGGPGCAMATAVIAWFMLLIAAFILKTELSYRPFLLFGAGFTAPIWHRQRALLKLGIPMGLSYLIEVTAFTFMALFIARLGDTTVAGHQITANFATLLYMLPLSIASATSTLVAQSIGAQRLDVARQISHAGIRLAAILSATIGCLVWLARDIILHAYTPDESIIASALPLFVFIAFYQLFDAIQVTAAFILRAYKVTIIPVAMYAVALWGIGLGGGYVLGLDPFGISPPMLQGATGFWLGNSVSLAVIAIALLWYLHKVQSSVAHSRHPDA